MWGYTQQLAVWIYQSLRTFEWIPPLSSNFFSQSFCASFVISSTSNAVRDEFSNDSFIKHCFMWTFNHPMYTDAKKKFSFMALFLSWSFLLYFDQLGVIHTLWWASCFHYFQKIIYCYFEVCACCSWNFSQSLSYVLYLTTIQLNIYPIFLICTWLQLFGVFLVGIPMEMDSRRNGVKNNILNQLGKAQLSQSMPVAYSSEKMPEVKNIFFRCTKQTEVRCYHVI